MKESRESPQNKVRELFSRKSYEYSKSSLLVNQQNLDRMLEIAGIQYSDRVLDVATGTGFMAAAIANAVGAQVIATDFTIEMLQEARKLLPPRSNIMLAMADADSLPFAPTSFDVVTCRVAVHHFANPQTAFKEMARVLKVGGRLLVMDPVSPDDEKRNELHHQMCTMRDPSEVRQWKCSELVEMIRKNGLSIDKIEQWQHQMAFQEWIRLGGADTDTTERLREMMISSMDGDKAGFNPYFVDEQLFFEWTTAIIRATKSAIQLETSKKVDNAG